MPKRERVRGQPHFRWLSDALAQTPLKITSLSEDPRYCRNYTISTEWVQRHDSCNVRLLGIQSPPIVTRPAQENDSENQS